MDARQDTIAAISTPQGRGGIGIIRISGPSVIDIINQIISTKIDVIGLSQCHTRRLFYAVLHDLQGNKIDEILVAYLPEEKSYTAEKTIELNCHGGKAIIAYAMETVIQAGARMALPGEFTRRAMENGRINLIQAESVNELIHARTKKAVRAAWKQMDGSLTDKCNELKIKISNVISEMQAIVDFEVEEKNLDWIVKIDEIKTIIGDILLSAEKGRFLTHGCWVVLSGPPNAGKSSLFNNILNTERALVTDQPGTTRDHISEVIEIDGIEVRLTDTAGIRKTNDEIEMLSIEKSEQQLKSADIIVYVLDQNQTLQPEQREKAESIIKANGFVLLNKSDLSKHPSVEQFCRDNISKKILEISIITKDGVDFFLDQLAENINDMNLNSENVIITSLRQSKLLQSAYNSINKAMDSIKTSHQYDITLYEMNSAANFLSEIIGEISTDEILDSIFSRFCIGK